MQQRMLGYVLGVVLAASCWSPRYENCTLRCGLKDRCPESLICSDGFCNSPGIKSCASAGAGGTANAADAASEVSGAAGQSQPSTPDAAAGSAAGGAGGGAANECPPGVVLCDGFESGKVDATWLTASKAASEIVVSDARKRSGAYALRARGSGAALVLAELMTAAKLSLPVFHLRTHVFIPLETPRVDLIMARITLEGDASGMALEHYEDRTLGQTSFGFAAGVLHARDVDVSVPRGEWVCVEWAFSAARGTAPGDARIWLKTSVFDSELRTHIDNVAEWGSVQRLELGLVEAKSAQAISNLELWFDDVIVDDARIGCN